MTAESVLGYRKRRSAAEARCALSWLAWYICGVCLLLALLSSAITYHPDSRHLGMVLPAAFGGVALLAGGVAVGIGRLPTTAPSPPVKAALGRPGRGRGHRDAVAGPGGVT